MKAPSPSREQIALGLLMVFSAALSLSAQPGSLDPAFYRQAVPDDTVFAVAVQPDGKVLAGGTFTKVSGVPRNGIARLNPNASLDPGFNPGLGVEGGNAAVYALAVYTNGTSLGKIVIAGSFTNFHRVARYGVARLNPDGTLDAGFNPGSGIEDGEVYGLAIQSDGRIVACGSFTTVQGAARAGITRFNANGSLDTNFKPGTGADGVVYAVEVQPDGKILLGGTFTTIRGSDRGGIARLTSSGALDALSAFDPGTGAEGGAVYALALQSDGKVLLAGDFTSVRGAARDGVGRLNANGTLDTSFAPNSGAANTIWAVATLPDGKTLVGGEFSSISGEPRAGIAQLSANGLADATFDPGLGINVDHGEYLLSLAVQNDGRVVVGGNFELVDDLYRPRVARFQTDGSVDRGFNQESGTFDALLATVIQPDGRLLLGGQFSRANGVPRAGVARLQADGLLDESFDPGTGATGPVTALALYTNGANSGKVLLGGRFTEMNGAGANGLARLNANGGVDADFSPAILAGDVAAVALQSDGRILIGGAFTNVNGSVRNGLARLNSDGSMDAGFDPGRGIRGEGVYALAIQTDGRLVIGGAFTEYDGAPRHGVARLQSNGTVDPSFQPGSGVEVGVVFAVAVQPDGKVVIGGRFTSVRGVARNGIARFNADGTLDGSFDPGDGVGSGEVRSLALQANGQLLVGGRFSSFARVPCGGIARVNGDGSFDYGFDAGAGVAQARAAVYAISLQPDGKVFIGGSFLTMDDADASNIARLLGGAAVPAPPRLVSWPASQTAFSGERLTFAVKASGSKPLFYQWRANGNPLAGATNSLLDFGNLSTAQAGSYTVVLTNRYGSITSSIIVLTVIATVDLALSVDAPGLNWGTGLDRNWYGQTAVNQDGADAAQSGPIGNNQQSLLGATVQGPGRLTFWWKVSSEEGYDFLQFFINDGIRASITGEFGWQRRSYAIPAGQVDLAWIYSKDSAFAGGQDAGWVDEVTYVQAAVLTPSRLPDGRFRVMVQATPGQRVEVQASTDLITWATIAVLTLESSTAQFIDDSALNFRWRFYRSATLP